MDNNQISAEELLAKLKENIGDEIDGAEAYSPQKYKISKSKADEQIPDDSTLNDIAELFESPVPKSEISDLDEDALMKMYLSPEDYEFLTSKKSKQNAADAVQDKLETTLDDLGDDDENPGKDYEVPDADIYDALNVDGKVCDVPQLEINEKSAREDNDRTTVVPDATDVKESAVHGFSDKDDDETIPVAELGELLSRTEEIDADDTFADIPIIPVKIPVAAREEKIEEKPPVTAQEEPVEEKYSVPDDRTMIVAEPSGGKAGSGAAPTDTMETTLDSAGDTLDKTLSDDTDVNIMLAFGMDEELDRAVGKEKADQMRSNNESSAEDLKSSDAEKTPDREYTDLSETKEFAELYRKKFARNTISMFGVIISTIILFFYENVAAMGGKLPDALNPEYYPKVNTMVGLQILFAAFVFAYPYFVRGVRALVARRPTVESALPLIAAVSTVYAFLSMGFVAGTVFPVMFFPAAVAVLSVVISRRFDLRRETLAFGIVSSKRVKFALERLDAGGAKLETNTFNEYLPESPELFKITKTNFVDNYFANTNAYPSVKQILNLLMAGTGAAAFAGFVVGLIKSGTWSGGLSVAYTAFTFCLPVSLFLCFSLPSLRGQKIARADGSAFVGEAVIDNYSSAASISFEDREVFPTSGVKLCSIKMFRDEGRIDNAISYLSSVYSRIGGPLSDVLNVATADLPKANDIEVISVEADGAEAVVDKRHIYVGKIGYISRKGYVAEPSPEDDDLESGNTAVTYLVVDDEVYAKVYVRYVIDPEFESMVKTLYKSGICVGIKTLDPNINDSMLSARIKLDKYPVRVLKYTSVDEVPQTSSKVDSGIVSKKSAKALLRTFTMCEKIKHVTKTNIVITGIAMIIGLLISVAVAIFGNVSSIASVYAVLYQIFWILPAYGAARLLMI